MNKKLILMTTHINILSALQSENIEIQEATKEEVEACKKKQSMKYHMPTVSVPKVIYQTPIKQQVWRKS